MSRILRLSLAFFACLLAAAPAALAAKAKYPSISKISPMKAGVGDSLTITGKNFRSGKGKNFVVFQRLGGRAVFVKSGKATSKKLTVTIPAKLLSALTQKSGKPVGTRFRVRISAARLGLRFTAAKSSPVIGPTTVTSKVNANDCDGDGVTNAKDSDDDGDLLSDTLEATLKTDSCKKDSDGDGMTDGWEYESALDYNGRAKPSPNKRPYPNALDAKDGAIDSDGDGLTNALEYAAWATYGAAKLPLNYSGGDPASVGKLRPGKGQELFDRDGNGFLSDNERDADGDGLSNQDEGGVGPLPALLNKVGFFADEYIGLKEVHDVVDSVPLYGPLAYVHKVNGTSWLDVDSDGDTVSDGADDQDGDGLSNLSELADELAAPASDKTQRPLNACSPNLDSRMCILGDEDIDKDGNPNRTDDDDDGDLLADTVERGLGLNPFKKDTDGDAVDDGYEYYAAKDLNQNNAPRVVDYPKQQSYPNPLDKGDADVDHDGDGLTLTEEFKAWKKFGGDTLPLSYSDGKQYSTSSTLDADRDVDQDGVSNIAETSGPLSSSAFWAAYTSSARIKCTPDYVETKYYGPDFQGLDFVNEDSDGDGLADGADDIDHDGVTNAEEGNYTPDANGFRNPRVGDWCATYVSVGPGAGHPGTGTATQPATPDKYARVDPFNPCKPVNSSACHRFVPFGYYKETGTYVEDWKGAEPDPNHTYTVPPLAPR